jgi:hypothetical protein
MEDALYTILISRVKDNEKYVETYNQDLSYPNSYRKHQTNKNRSIKKERGDKKFMW